VLPETQGQGQAVPQPGQLILGHLYGLIKEKNKPLFSLSHFNLDLLCLEISLEAKHHPS